MEILTFLFAAIHTKKQNTHSMHSPAIKQTVKLILGLISLGTILLGQSLAQHAEQSVLSQGNWYKVGITETGVVRLDYTFLNSIGMDIANLNPRRIQVYGNGGQLLPQQNAAFRHDDLQQNSIRVEGEADGSFDPGDAIVFYAEGPHTWYFNERDQTYRHQLHFYADTNYYFITVGSQDGKRVNNIEEITPSTEPVDTLQNYAFYEQELENPLNSGRVWLGERMDLSNRKDFAFYLPDANGDINIRLSLAARSDVPTYFTLEQNGQVEGSISINNVNVGSEETPYYNRKVNVFTLPASAVGSGDSLRFSLVYDVNGSSRSEGWLDWVEVVYDQRPRLSGQDVWHGTFRPEVAGEDVHIQLQNGSSAYRLWDITDPTDVKQIPYSLNGSQMTAVVPTTDEVRLLAYKSTNVAPVSGRAIPTQNLHGIGIEDGIVTPVDYVVVTHPSFVSEANRLADFHANHYGRNTAVVTVDQIYNEFSSGKQDVSAIRDFIRMLYLRSAGLGPVAVCMFGDGSYRYKYINEAINQRTNFVPTYQSRDSRDPTDSYTSDDFFAMMDEDEGYWGEGSGYEGDGEVEVATLDVGVGRLPIESIEQAQQVVDKIIRYATNPDGQYFGDWRNKVVLVADHRDVDGSTHVSQANSYTAEILQNAGCMDLEKLYMDNYRMEISAGNESFPDGRGALLQAMDEGSLILNYTGHGSENAWSYGRIWQNADIDNMDNFGRYPAVVTATCEYGRYDNPDKRSGAELMMMHPNFGAIAMFTTVRLVYSSPNKTLNENFYGHVFTYDSTLNRNLTLGEIMARTKNSTFPRSSFTNINSRNFTLLGDPGLILNYPEHHAYVTAINERPIDPSVPDSLRSLGLIKVEGLIADDQGNLLSDYNGDMEVTVFDKPSTYTTQRSRYTFTWQTNRIFNGSALVEDGKFEFEFVVPIDISYENGDGKISLYFNTSDSDGAGCYDNLYVGGTDPDAALDDQGPTVNLYLNDSTWRDGGLTGPNPDLFATVFDENGINTTGTGIGHEIIAVLDEDERNVFVLNDAYQALPGSYQYGTIRYPLENLEVGEHQLRIRVWDVANNSSEDITTFIVADDAVMALDLVLNQPNPFIGGEGTEFVITHNQNGKDLSLRIDITDMQGRQVTTLVRDFTAEGNVISGIKWDGTSSEGVPIADGSYIYRVSLVNQETGEAVRAARRLVVIR